MLASGCSRAKRSCRPQNDPRPLREPEEIAQAASYLLSDYASYVTGENFVIDGGQWLSGADYFTRLKQMMPR
jgi:NAD(P)-dependent dehydrogenase (short-subunit alcohol dehydrogenase family)